jgi:hypothetical protein
MAAEPDNALKAVLDEVEVLLEPLIDAAEGPRERQLLFQALGWDVDAITGLPVTALDAALSPVPALVESLTDGLDVSDFPKILDALQKAGEAIAAVEKIKTAVGVGLSASEAEALAVDLLNFLVLRYVGTRFPRVYAFLTLATLIDLPDPPSTSRMVVDSSSQRLVHDGARRPVVRFDRLPRLFTEPDKLFKEVYWPNGITSVAAAEATADRLLPQIAGLIQAFGGNATYGVDPGTGLTFGSPANSSLVAHMLTFNQPLPSADVGGALVSS